MASMIAPVVSMVVPLGDEMKNGVRLMVTIAARTTSTRTAVQMTRT